MRTIGVTGGSGAGKSVLLAQWASLGAVVIDADEVYHRLLREDTALLASLRAAFPEAFPSDTLDRRALGKMVFADKGKLARLEFLTHGAVVPAIRHIIDTARREGRSAVAVDAIRLLETPLGREMDVLVGVTAPKADRIARIMARDGISEDYARARLSSQPEDDYYRAQVDYFLENNVRLEVWKQIAREVYYKIIGGCIHE